MHTPETGAAADCRQQLRTQTATVERVVHGIARRFALSRDAELDLLGNLYVKLLEDDCHALRTFAGRSRFSTYLTVVGTRLLLDMRNHNWGKWRPSSEARRFGVLGITLERLRRRDGLNREECVAMLVSQHPEVSESCIRAIDAQLPAITPRQAVVEAAIAHLRAPAVSPEEPVANRERRNDAGAIDAALRRVFMQLSKDDRRLVRLRFRDAVPVVTIAKKLGIDQRRLYRRYENILRQLRSALEDMRVTRGTAAAVVGRYDIELGSALEDSAA